MADVFISYAREDKAHAQRLADEIKATGLTVWWDRDLVPTEEWDEAIEREIIAAAAVVVVWTPNSVQNPNVKEEAHEARNLDKLAPVKIGDCRPPMFFRRHQFQDLSDWRGDGTAIEFKRLVLQLIAYARGEEIAETLPPLESPEPYRLSPAQASSVAKDGPLTRWINGLVALSVVLCLIAAYRGFEMQHVVGAYWAWIVTLAVSAVALFRAAEYALPKGPKALVSRWLAGEKSFTSAEAFLTMFEGVFGKRHWALACFSRSVIATLAVYLALLALFVDFNRLGAQATAEGAFNPRFEGGDYDLKARLENGALLLLVIVPLVNIVADYVSLWQTRKVLEWSTGSLPLWLGVVFDALLTGAVFLALLPLGPTIAIFCADGKIGTGSDAVAYAAFSPEAFEQALAFIPEVWRGFWMIFEGNPIAEIDAVLAGEASLSTTTLLIAFATTFITSIWLWFALLAAPLFWLMAAGSRRGAGWLGRITGAARRPILWLGYGAAAILLMLGYGFQQGAKALQTAREPEPFRDCEACPWMVVIPPGPFPAGTQFAKAGVEIKQPFAMGVYEVTFREWDSCAAEGYCRPIADDRGWGRGLRPAINVSWEDITGEKAEDDGYRGFLAWMNDKPEVKAKGARYRLPSEAEWEYAARAGSTTAYWLGDEISHKQANFNDQELGRGDSGWYGRTSWSGHVRGQTLPVGAFEPNPFGLHGVHGNVWEWVDDCWNGSLEGQPVDGGSRRDGDCSMAVLRGGSWYNSAGILRSANRGRYSRNNRDDIVGFRLARTAVE